VWHIELVAVQFVKHYIVVAAAAAAVAVAAV